MSTQGPDVPIIILGLKKHFGVGSDEALAAKLGVAKSTIATWRRRSNIPVNTTKELEEKHGLRLSDLININSDVMREYILRQSYYFVILKLHKGLVETGMSAADEVNFADDLALIEPYLKRVIVRASSNDRYRGVAGAASFLLDLRAGDLDGTAWVTEANAERRRDLPT